MKSLNEVIAQTRHDIISIISLESYRPDYQFFPARIKVELLDNKFDVYVLKASRKDSILFEVALLTALNEIGLSVPQIKSEVIEFTYEGTAYSGVLMEELKGKSLQWLGVKDLNTADITCQLAIKAIKTLHSLTPNILKHNISRIIPVKTLKDELNFIIENSAEWKNNQVFQTALELMKKQVPKVTTPLVFSNGDYNPLNFICEEDRILGWIDFEHACIEDPYIGFAKFFLWADDEYGWGMGRKSGLVEKFLFENVVAPHEFYIRLILRGLTYIQNKSTNEPPLYMLDIVDKYTKLVLGY